MRSVTGVIVPGHQVASGGNGNPRFPGGTIRMQLPFFLALGLDLSNCYPGTINLDIAPLSCVKTSPKRTFSAVKWHPSEPAEDFSFVECIVPRHGNASGWIYYPHPETKPTHFQPGTVIELLLPHISGLNYGDQMEIQVPEDQMDFI